MKDKRIVLLAVIIFVCSALTILSFAHSGGTDSAGGHYDRSTGEYHYHHGYPAHQHPDGICPYGGEDISPVKDYYSEDYEYDNETTYSFTTTTAPNDSHKTKDSSSFSDVLDVIQEVFTWIVGIVSGLWILFRIGTFLYVLFDERKKK